MQLTITDRFEIFENALRQKQAIIIDWKASVWDIVEEIKTILPDLAISAPHEKQVQGDWIEFLVLNGKEYQFKQESPSLILDVIAIINTVIKDEEKAFVFFDTQDDSYNFILINLPELSSYTKRGFRVL